MHYNYPYGKKTEPRKKIWYAGEDEQSIRDFTKAYKPTHPGKFADWLIKKYPKWRGHRGRILMVIEDQLRQMREEAS